MILPGALDNRIFNLPLQYRITKISLSVTAYRPRSSLRIAGGYLFLTSQCKRSGIYPRKIPLPLLSGRCLQIIFPKNNVFVFRQLGVVQCKLKRNVNVFVTNPVKCVVDWY